MKLSFGKYVAVFCALAVPVSALWAIEKEPKVRPEDPILAKPVEGKLDYKVDDYRNYFGCWIGHPKDNLRFARNMAIRHLIYLRGMENLPESKGMYFYFSDPEYCGVYKRMMDFKKVPTYTKEQIAHWMDFCAMKDASLPFPDCMATGWFNRFNHREWKPDHPEYGVVTLVLNMQKKKVIDAVVKRNKERAEAIEKRNPDFKFAGFVWDVPQLDGDFWGEIRGKTRVSYKQCGLSHWRGVDSASFPKGQKPDYPTYSEGRVAFYRAMRAAFAGREKPIRLIVDPALIWGHYLADFVRLGVKPGDPALADYIQLEAGSDNYLKNKKAWSSGYIKAENTATACDLYAYDFLKEIRAVGASASVGAWSVWFGNPCPTLTSIRDVPARMKISRAVATWENLNNTPISQRHWDSLSNTYNSPTAHLSKDVVWAIHPETKKLFFCFLNPDAKIKLPKGMTVKMIRPLTPLFDEYMYPSVFKNFDIKDGYLSLSKKHAYSVGDAFVAELKKE